MDRSTGRCLKGKETALSRKQGRKLLSGRQSGSSEEGCWIWQWGSRAQTVSHISEDHLEILAGKDHNFNRSITSSSTVQNPWQALPCCNPHNHPVKEASITCPVRRVEEHEKAAELVGLKDRWDSNRGPPDSQLNYRTLTAFKSEKERNQQENCSTPLPSPKRQKYKPPPHIISMCCELGQGCRGVKSWVEVNSWGGGNWRICKDGGNGLVLDCRPAATRN